MISAECPECEARIKLGDQPFIGQRVTCFDCGADLIVEELSPPELGFVYDDEFEMVGYEDDEEYLEEY